MKIYASKTAEETNQHVMFEAYFSWLSVYWLANFKTAILCCWIGYFCLRFKTKLIHLKFRYNWSTWLNFPTTFIYIMFLIKTEFKKKNRHSKWWNVFEHALWHTVFRTLHTTLTSRWRCYNRSKAVVSIMIVVRFSICFRMDETTSNTILLLSLGSIHHFQTATECKKLNLLRTNQKCSNCIYSCGRLHYQKFGLYDFSLN